MLTEVFEKFNLYGVGTLELIEEGLASSVTYQAREGGQTFNFLLSTPPVRSLGPGRAELLNCYHLRGGALGDSGCTRRLVLPVLINTGIWNITSRTSSSDALAFIAAGEWQILRWKEMFLTALLRAGAALHSQATLTPSRVSMIFSRRISEQVMKFEPAQEDIQVSVRSAAMLLGYPGKDVSQGANPQVPQEVKAVLREAFWKKAQELGYDLVCTSKSSPGRKVLATGTVDNLQKGLGIFRNFAISRRSKRELWSLPNARQFSNDECTTPLVQSSADTSYMRGRIKYLNAAIAAPKFMVPNGASVDQLGITSWVTDDHLLDVEITSHVAVPFEGQSMEEVLKDFPEGATAELLQRPVGPGVEKLWVVETTSTHTSRELFKIVTPDGVKGMCQRLQGYYAEKRPGEDFFRPIHLLIPPETVISKHAARMLLRMHASRLGPVTVASDTPREEFVQTSEGLTKQVSPFSELFLFYPDTEGKDIPGLGHGDIVRLPGIFRTGEVAVMRLPEDEEHGRPYRGVQVDAFSTLGKGIHLEPDPAVVSRAGYLTEVLDLLK